ncbi:MAG: dodecin family protein [Balneolales bacterium]
MPIIKVIEVIASSNKSFDDATRNAVKEASSTIKNIQSIYIKEMKAYVDNNEITSFGVNALISFEVNH